MQLLNVVARFGKKVRFLIETGITWIALFLVYCIGIGLTSLVGKLFNRRFLRHKFHRSSWQPITGSQQLERMF
jgi:hypothetical protein